MLFFFSSRRRHTRLTCDWSSDVCSSDQPSSDCDIINPHPHADAGKDQKRNDIKIRLINKNPTNRLFRFFKKLFRIPILVFTSFNLYYYTTLLSKKPFAYS